MVKKQLDEFSKKLIEDGWKQIIVNLKPKKFTLDMLKIVHENYQYKKDEDICQEIFNKFNVKINKNTIRVYRNHLGWNKNKRGQILYKKGFEDGVKFAHEQEREQ